jgi:regulator of RNase E activity RraA
MLGYAVTGYMRSTASPVRARACRENMNWWRYVESIPKPRVMVVEDIDDIPGAGASLGEQHAVIGMALDCLGAVEAFGLHLFAGGVAVSHTYAHICEYGEPVAIGGLKILSGSLIHGDRHGVHCIPLSIASDIPKMATQILREESELKQFCRSPRFSLDALEKKLQKPPGNGFELPLRG